MAQCSLRHIFLWFPSVKFMHCQDFVSVARTLLSTYLPQCIVLHFMDVCCATLQLWQWRHVMTHNCLQTQLTARHQLNNSAVNEWTAAEDEGDIIPPTNLHIDTYTRFISHKLMQSNTVLQLLLSDFMNFKCLQKGVDST